MMNDENRPEELTEEVTAPEETAPAGEPAPEAAAEPVQETPAQEAPEQEPAEAAAPAESVPENTETDEDDLSMVDLDSDLLEQIADASVVEVNGQTVAVDDLLSSFRKTDKAADAKSYIEVEEEKKPVYKPKPASAIAAPVEPPKEGSAASKVNAENYLIKTSASQVTDSGEVRHKRRKRGIHFFYYIAEALRGIFAHGFMSFAAVGIITACLLIMGCFSLLAINVNAMLDNLMDRNEFLAYVDESYSREDAIALQDQIEQIPNVAEITFITREEAKADYIEDQGDSDLYDDLPDYIFRDRYAIHVDDLTQIQETSQEVLALDGIAKISVELDVAQGFVTVRNVVMIVALVLVAILFLISLFIVSNTIKMVSISRGDEIAIMRMCGATSRFIRKPFIYEGAILGLLGAGIAFGLVSGIYEVLYQFLQSSGRISLFTVVPFVQLYPYVLGAFIVAALIIGAGGSGVTIRKFLKV